MAGDQGGDPARWTARLDGVERLIGDDADDDEDTFAVHFEMNGLGVNGTLTTMVTGSTDETRIIAEALAMLQDGLRQWSRVLAQRTERDPANDG